ncbi:tetratricopeptide repeat protein [Streptomyces sp. GC420]|uniref:tetratricopeptide repeat protein n=1 Tax=Streptomyces sp. GC420 TaxID=2697568 RepID=UPI001414EA1D|nr:tetratricopeptide repeat protein [Streptomyces sp. GC420]NBM20773.1 tetratricopeptide repeat protein [Streptomyces sp. GC420]
MPFRPVTALRTLSPASRTALVLTLASAALAGGVLALAPPEGISSPAALAGLPGAPAEMRGPALRKAEALAARAARANERGDFRAARAWAEKARRTAPGHPTAYQVLADAYTGLGAYKEASRTVWKLAGLRPGLQASLLTAREYRVRGLREDAEGALGAAMDAASTPTERAACLFRLGELAREQGEDADALAYFERALRLEPRLHEALAGRAAVLAALGRTGAALADYARAVSGSPRAEYLLAWGELLESLGRLEEAEKQYTRLRAGGGDVVTRGLFETDHGDPAAGVRLLEAEWRRGIRSVELADALGWALHGIGAHGEALAYARKAGRLGTRSALFVYHRGMIESSLGLPGPARRHLAEALRINPRFSPLGAPTARETLAELGEPTDGGGPERLEWPPAPVKRPSGERETSAERREQPRGDEDRGGSRDRPGEGHGGPQAEPDAGAGRGGPQAEPGPAPAEGPLESPGAASPGASPTGPPSP